MLNDTAILIVIASSVFGGAILVLIGVMAGAWVMFRGKSSVGTQEGFLGKVPKGEVFCVTDGLDDSPAFPGTEQPTKDEERILKKTGDFLKGIGGG